MNAQAWPVTQTVTSDTRPRLGASTQPAGDADKQLVRRRRRRRRSRPGRPCCERPALLGRVCAVAAAVRRNRIVNELHTPRRVPGNRDARVLPPTLAAKRMCIREFLKGRGTHASTEWTLVRRSTPRSVTDLPGSGVAGIPSCILRGISVYAGITYRCVGDCCARLGSRDGTSLLMVTIDRNRFHAFRSAFGCFRSRWVSLNAYIVPVRGRYEAFNG